MSLSDGLKLPKIDELALGLRVTHISFGIFRLDTDHDLLLRDGEKVPVSHKGLLLLKTLVEARGRPVSKQELMDAVWPGLAIEENNLAVQIAGLRKVLGAAPGGGSWIMTIPRGGYRFLSAPSEDLPPLAEPAKRPSILVLPFVNVSGDRTQDYVADGITEDLIIALSRFRWFSVIPQNPGFLSGRGEQDLNVLAAEHNIGQIVEGTLRRDGNRIRITARLRELPGGNQIWGNDMTWNSATSLRFRTRLPSGSQVRSNPNS